VKIAFQVSSAAASFHSRVYRHRYVVHNVITIWSVGPLNDEMTFDFICKRGKKKPKKEKLLEIISPAEELLLCLFAKESFGSRAGKKKIRNSR
jgi:hypothetical protein